MGKGNGLVTTVHAYDKAYDNVSFCKKWALLVRALIISCVSPRVEKSGPINFKQMEWGPPPKRFTHHLLAFKFE